MKWYILVFKKYATFNGRARRKEYWMFVLFNSIAGAILSSIDTIIDYQIFSFLYGLAVLVPGLALSVRRLQDINESWKKLFLVLIPIVGWIWLFVLAIKPGTVGENQYGPDPKNEQV